MIVVGIDPGYSLVGYGVIEVFSNQFKLIEAGCIDTSGEKNFSKKLIIIDNKISEIFDRYSPSLVGIERLYFRKNVKTGLKVSEVIGVIRVNIARRGIDLVEVTPLEVKRYLVGAKGYHPKVQLQNLVKIVFNLRETIKPDDANDAVAIALVVSNMNKG